jgi:hypothetical protein
VTPEQKAAFHAAIIDTITAQGTPVTTGGTQWGWMSDDCYELREHMAGCSPVYETSTWSDSEWTEFVGTFEPTERGTGIDLVLTCRCGTVQGRTWRYTGGYADLIRAITEAS